MGFPNSEHMFRVGQNLMQSEAVDYRGRPVARGAGGRGMSDTRDLTTGEAEAYRRGFADARGRAAAMCDRLLASWKTEGGEPDFSLGQEYAGDSIRDAICGMEASGEATGLEYRGG